MQQQNHANQYYDFQTRARGLLDADSLRRRFEKWAKWYASRLGPHLPRDRDAVCLDVPCGYGNFLYFLHRQGYRNVIGYDLDPEQIRLARLLDLPAHEGNALELLADEGQQFDCIASVDFLEHLSRDDALEFLRRCWLRLRPGGVLILRTPCADGPFGAHDVFNDLTHQWSLTSNVLRTILDMLDFERVAILDERPQAYDFKNTLRLLAFYPARMLAAAMTLAIGIPPPKVWSRAMWGIGYRPHAGLDVKSTVK